MLNCSARLLLTDRELQLVWLKLHLKITDDTIQHGTLWRHPLARIHLQRLVCALRVLLHLCDKILDLFFRETLRKHNRELLGARASASCAHGHRGAPAFQSARTL